MKIRVSGLSVIVSLLSSGMAFGQEPEGGEQEAMEATSSDEDMTGEAPPEPEPAEATEAPATAPAEAPSAPNSVAGDDGVRFRFGIAGGAGFLSGAGTTLVYGGGDFRFGAQINDLIGVYIQPQLGYYTTSGVTVGGGLIGATAVADFTFIDRIFVGAGLGYGILNNPSGPEVHLRVGGYPLSVRRSDKVRRQGLMLGADLRVHFLDGATFVAPTFNIGYEAF